MFVHLFRSALRYTGDMPRMNCPPHPVTDDSNDGWIVLLFSIIFTAIKVKLSLVLWGKSRQIFVDLNINLD